jgi:hypothetical protein
VRRVGRGRRGLVAGMVNLDARAELRAAVKRIVSAAYSKDVEVTVNVRDLFVVVALLVSYLGHTPPPAPVARPQLHPEQR